MVALEELRALFTGVPDADGWSSTPSYNIRLAVEIARLGGCATDGDLRILLYDETPVDEIPRAALDAIKLAASVYRNQKALNVHQ